MDVNPRELAREVAGYVRGQFAEALAPLVVRLNRLEARLDASAPAGEPAQTRELANLLRDQLALAVAPVESRIKRVEALLSQLEARR